MILPQHSYVVVAPTGFLAAFCAEASPTDLADTFRETTTKRAHYPHPPGLRRCQLMHIYSPSPQALQRHFCPCRSLVCPVGISSQSWQPLQSHAGHQLFAWQPSPSGMMAHPGGAYYLFSRSVGTDLDCMSGEPSGPTPDWPVWSCRVAACVQCTLCMQGLLCM